MQLQASQQRFGGSRLPGLSLRGAKRRGNLGKAAAISPMAFPHSDRVLRDCTPRALPRASRSGRHVGLRPPRNDKSGAGTVLTIACANRRFTAGRGMPLPAVNRRLAQAIVKTVPAPDLSLRGGRRPTWRPEREARGSALGVQSRSTRSECGKAIGEIAAAFPRLPRRFAPRNDKPGSLEPPNRCCDACSCIIPLRRGRAHSPQSGARRP